MSRFVVAALTAVLLLAACGSAPSPSPSSGPIEPVSGTDRDADFMLLLEIGKSRYAPDEPIVAQAALRYTGITGRAEAWGSGGGLIGFGVEQLGGVHRTSPAWQDDCARHVLAPLVQAPFQKSGGFSEDEPDAAWLRAFLTDPVFRLSAGRWRVFALADFYSTPGQPNLSCGDAQHRTLEAWVEIEVGP